MVHADRRAFHLSSDAAAPATSPRELAVGDQDRRAAQVAVASVTVTCTSPPGMRTVNAPVERAAAPARRPRRPRCPCRTSASRRHRVRAPASPPHRASGRQDLDVDPVGELRRSKNRRGDVSAASASGASRGRRTPGAGCRRRPPARGTAGRPPRRRRCRARWPPMSTVTRRSSRRRGAPHRARTRRVRRRTRRGARSPLATQVVREHPHAVAAHLGDRPVGVAVVHEPVARRAAGRRSSTRGSTAGRTTRSTPSAPIRRRRSHSGGHHLRRQVQRAVGVGQQHEVVLGAVALGEDQPSSRIRSHQGAEQVRAVEPADPMVAAEPRPLPADEPPGGAHGRLGGVAAVRRPSRRASTCAYPSAREAVRPRAGPSPSRPRTSSTRPAAHIVGVASCSSSRAVTASPSRRCTAS